MGKKDWFAVDREGLAALLERKGKAFAVLELIQNAWDADDVTEVEVSLTPIVGRAEAMLTVTDDAPDGFADLSHAFTLFARSTKLEDAEKRGRFNLGEKLFLALCKEATISSTKGSVVFNHLGRHNHPRAQRPRGSQVQAIMRMTREDIADVKRAVRSLIPPADIKTVFNAEQLHERRIEISFMTVLPTEIAGETGALRRTRRNTVVEVYEVLWDETAMIYEMGIPVVETGDRWHYNVQQKVPLNMERDNVTPAYLRDLRTAVFNHTHAVVTSEDANRWVRDALEDDAVEEPAVKSAVRAMFGDKAVVYDPSDIEANNVAVAQGYTVVKGSQLSKAAWENVRRAGALRPAGQVTPSNSSVTSSPDGVPSIPRDDWTPAMEYVARYAADIGMELIGEPVFIDIYSIKGLPKAAWYGDCHLSFNMAVLGKRWFEDPDPVAVDMLLIHEFAHHFAMNHLSHEFHSACCKLGAQLRRVNIHLKPVSALA